VRSRARSSGRAGATRPRRTTGSRTRWAWPDGCCVPQSSVRTA
jgi:hypothetical protein